MKSKKEDGKKNVKPNFQKRDNKTAGPSDKKKSAFTSKPKYIPKGAGAASSSSAAKNGSAKTSWDRKASKPNFAIVEKLKLSWNKVRLKNISPEERARVVNDMMKQVDQHVLAVTLRHDASRAVQSIIQFGSAAQRAKVLNDIKDKLSEV